MFDYQQLSSTHDLSLPDWGPYAKKYFGISHIADHAAGTRFDFMVIPGIYRRQFGIPDALRPSGYLPWHVAADLSSYSYRQQLEWKDKLYCDISFSPIDDHTRLVRCRCVNNGDLDIDIDIHFDSTLVPEPSGALHIDCREYLRPRLKSPRGLVPDCFFPGEVRMPDTVKGSAYRVDADTPFTFVPDKSSGGCCFVRCRFSGKQLWHGATGQLELEGNDSWRFYRLPGDWLNSPINSDAALLIDGLAICDNAAEPELSKPLDTMPHFSPGPVPDSLLISYEGISGSYAVKWFDGHSFVRLLAGDDFRMPLLYEDYLHQEFLDFSKLSGPDRQLDVTIQPLTVPAGGERIIYAAVADGSPAELAERLQNLPADLEKVYRDGAEKYINLPSPYRFSQERMAAVVMTNVVYPTYFAGKYVRHHSPGRRWNCLYTWDSGFIGLGMLEFDLKRAVENLNAYLTPPGDADNAFVLHGSPVPVQLYLFFEIWNRTHDREFLTAFYPRVAQYYHYMAGRNGSLTRTHSNAPFICTWDYFYNSGGWDDYPPQLAMHNDRRSDIIPAVGTCHIIRCAKMLRMAARELGEDTALYDSDIAELSASLQKYAWDADAGYFSYVEHDKEGNPCGFFRHASGANYNMGLDGTMPLVAGITSGDQRQTLWSKLSTPGKCWCDCGLSTVDRSAPYFRNNGYWNGTVWMPYQYFYWKAALNDGESDFAWRIADTALQLWEKEVQHSHACYEQFATASGRGAGWHHFSALSAPVLSFAGAYYNPGKLTTGYDVWQKSLRSDASSLTAGLSIGGNTGDVTTVITLLPGNGEYRATYNGTSVPVKQRGSEFAEITLPKNSTGVLTVERHV